MLHYFIGLTSLLAAALALCAFIEYMNNPRYRSQRYHKQRRKRRARRA